MEQYDEDLEDVDSAIDDGDHEPEDNGNTPDEPEDNGNTPDEHESQDDKTEPAPVGGMIPKARFNEVNERMKQAESRLRELEAAVAAQQPAGATAPDDKAAAHPDPLEELNLKYTEALLDGDVEAAAKINAQIHTAVRESAKRDALEEFQRVNATRDANTALDQAAAGIVAKYPFLDDSHESADEEAIAEVIEWRNFLVAQKGLSPAVALTEAAEKVARFRGAAAVDAGKASVTDIRSREATQRASRMSRAQPPAAVGVGTRSDARGANIESMSEAEFEALPEAEKRRMRGDY